MNHTKKTALLIFTRNPELGKCKTRLAATIGNQAALDVYRFLIKHTVSITAPLQLDKFVYYSVAIRSNDYWDETRFIKKLQKGEDLGVRMKAAFNEVFNQGYEQAIIIGSDMYDLSTIELEQAFLALNESCLLYTSPSPRDKRQSRMPSSA